MNLFNNSYNLTRFHNKTISQTAFEKLSVKINCVYTAKINSVLKSAPKFKHKIR